MRSQWNWLLTAVYMISAVGAIGCCGPLRFHGCRSGCGELYVDPWINDPAHCCDPCDSCGNHQGQVCDSCRPLNYGIKTIWGYRYNGGTCGCETAGCDGVGCDSIIEPGCGCGVAGCDEVSCGFEPVCGVESCSGCAGCSGGGHGFVNDGSMLDHEPVIVDGHSILDEEGLESARIPVPRGRRIFRGSPHVAGSHSMAPAHRH